MLRPDRIEDVAVRQRLYIVAAAIRETRQLLTRGPVHQHDFTLRPVIGNQNPPLAPYAQVSIEERKQRPFGLLRIGTLEAMSRAGKRHQLGLGAHLLQPFR